VSFIAGGVQSLCCCVKLVSGNWCCGPFGNPEESKRLQQKALLSQGEEDCERGNLVCPVVSCEL
jgi:hypothetical protein